MLKVGVFALFCLVTTIHSKSVGDIKDAKAYLARYGYTKGFNTGPKEMEDGLKRLQHFANLPTTGKLDVDTIKQMAIPRCGLEDPQIKVKRVRKYTHQGSTWSKNKLTWRLANRGRTLGRETIRRIMYKAFSFWSDVTNLDFKEVSNQEPDIWVRFVTDWHNDPYAFDGPGGTLAHAFYPHNNKGLSGDVHFDDAEDYTAESAFGRNLLWVATHEIGHSIGLEHSNVREAVMYPWYTKYKPGFKLLYDDILGIQMLYGSRSKTPATTTTTTRRTTPTTTTTTTTTTTRRTTRRPKPSARTTKRPNPKANACPIGGIKSVYHNGNAGLNILLTNNNKLYFVKKEGGIRYGPVTVSNYISTRDINRPIDAAVSITVDGVEKTIYFVGDEYFVYKNFRYMSGPHSIHGNKGSRDKNPLRLKFPTWVRKMDAAMTWQRNGRTYFFAGDRYWRYNSYSKRFDNGYPRRTQTAWRGLPSRIDAALSTKDNKKTFFISGDKYYLLNDNAVRVERGYPKHIGTWLQCGDYSSGNLGIGEVSIGYPNDPRGEEP